MPVLFFLAVAHIPLSAQVSFSARADVPSQKIEDDSALRIFLADTWFRETPGRVLARSPELYTLRGGSRVQVRVETSSQNRDEFAIVLAREQNGAYPGWAQGSWILSRRRDNNSETSRIRVFLRSDYNTYVQFRPFSEEKCRMDVVIYGGYVIRSLPIPVPFERLYVLPVEEALALAGDRFPRRYFDIESGAYRDNRNFIAAVRARLPELAFADDGAIDEHGNYVYIETLAAQDSAVQSPAAGNPPAQAEPEGADGRGGAAGNGTAQNPSRGGLNCSGFAKWIADGILRPLTGERLPITPLKEPFGERGTEFTERWEARDPFFGLDWCRNLASRVGAGLRGPALGALEEIEVREWPFSQVIIRGAEGSSVYAYPGYLRNAGFGTEGLQPLLYTLAVDEPGHIYFAAVNNEIGAPVTPDNPRGLPRMRQYYHIAVLVPYFTEQGVFHVAVFESAAETSFARFRSRYPGEFVNLARVPIESAFDP